MSFLNPFVIKKYIAIFLTAMLPATSMMLAAIMGLTSWMYLTLFLFGGTLICMPLALWLLRTPFTTTVENNTLMAINMDSTGIMRVYDLQLLKPKLKLETKDEFGQKLDVFDVFNRGNVFNLTTPESQGVYTEKEGHIYIKMPLAEFHAAKFGLYARPVFIFNENLKRFITKEYFSDLERKTFTEQNILYLLHVAESLSTSLRDFGRYFMELFKPKEKLSLLSSNWFWIILIAGLALIAIFFGKPILAQIQGMAGAAAGG